MKSLIVYDSQFGNTEKLAGAVCEVLQSSGGSTVLHASKASLADLKGIDLLVLASPTVGWNVLPAMQAFMALLTPEALKGKSAACFDSIMHGPRFLMKPAAGKVAETLQALEAKLTSPAMDFYVTGREGPLQKGEIERAREWAKTLVK
jgi:flavodoxin I